VKIKEYVLMGHMTLFCAVSLNGWAYSSMRSLECSLGLGIIVVITNVITIILVLNSPYYIKSLLH